MNNTELIDIFRDSLNDSTVLLPTHPGPPELGGPTQQHLTTHFKLNNECDSWSRRAVETLATMVNSFPGPYRFYQLNDPKRDCVWEIISDPEIEIRRLHINMPEEWTVPAPGLSDKELSDFRSRKRWDAHTKVVFEVVFQFNQEVN